jgi:hypothetical protein
MAALVPGAQKKTSSIWALSLEVERDDMRKLIANLTENARLSVKRWLTAIAHFLDQNPVRTLGVQSLNSGG